MKRYSFSRIALLACALAMAGVTTTFAQDQPTPPPSGGAPAVQLTADEKAKLKKDQDAVFAANPDLKTEHDNLVQNRPDSDASDADKQAFRQKMMAFHHKMHDAVLKVDPTAGPLLAKSDAAHHHGPPPAPVAQ
jgi:hypothetical protein